MEFPRPSPRAYVGTTLTVLATLAVLQYAGVFFEGAGEIDFAYLLGVGLVLPLATYLLTLVAANVDALPDWDEMNRSE